jgi:kynurenine formamidase
MTTPAIVDLSHPLDESTPVYPGDGPLEITVAERASDPPVGGRRSLNCSRVALSVHTGTHLDAPFHFFDAGRTVDCVPLEHCVGPALLVDLGGVGAGQEIETRHLAPYRDRLRETGRVVLHTGWWRQWGTPDYFTEHPRLSGQAAEFLVECGVRLVGVDTPSVDQPPFPAHLALLGSGVLIVENLTNLSAIGREIFQLVVLPLRISGRDGSPVRAIAMEL